MTAPALPPPAVWLESRYDRAQRLRAAYYQLERKLMAAGDPHRHAAIDAHLKRLDAALTRLGATP